MQTSSDLAALEHRSRLTNIIDHLMFAQKRADTTKENEAAASTFVNEQLKR